MKLLVGLNPYGLAYTVGLQGSGTPRAHPSPGGLDRFLALARELGSASVEVHAPWLDQTAGAAARVREACAALGAVPLVSAGLTHERGETLERVVAQALAVGATTIRLGLTPVLEGSRARWGDRWHALVAHARDTLAREAPRAAAAGLTIAIEDHQDFGSEELVEMAESAGANVGIVFDTGNPFAVGEDPVAFARRAASHVRHLHLKDYVAQFTDEGYRLIRCTIGDGAVPFADLRTVLSAHHQTLTASVEPGALEARHIRLFTPEWWNGYPRRAASELATAIGRLRAGRLPDNDGYATPWERGAAPDEIVDYELAQVRRSVANMTAFARETP
jgi:sugar phosphate isomerase/epimerase